MPFNIKYKCPMFMRNVLNWLNIKTGEMYTCALKSFLIIRTRPFRVEYEKLFNKNLIILYCVVSYEF